MTVHFEDCPNEIIGDIIVLLEFDDIRNLRRTCKSLAYKTTQNRFKSFFRSKHVDVTESALSDFVYATQAGRLGTLVENLILIGVVNNTAELESVGREWVPPKSGNSDLRFEEQNAEMAKNKQDFDILRQRQAEQGRLYDSGRVLSLLRDAFCNIATNSRTGKLPTLSLQTVVYRLDSQQRLNPADRHAGSWKLIWRCAARTFHTAVCALATSRLPIDKFDVFCGLQRCSLACNELSGVDWKDQGLATSLASLKSLSISLSNRPIDETEEDRQRIDDPAEGMYVSFPLTKRPTQVVRSEASDEKNFTGLADVFQLCNQLKSLEVHYYCLNGPTTIDPQHETLLQRMVEADKLPDTLERCRLRGAYIREHDLLTFLEQTKLRNLSMEGVTISSGTFRFEYCSSEKSGMQHMIFDDLFEHDREKPVGFLLTGSLRASTTLDRAGDDIESPILYALPAPGARVNGSPKARDRRIRLRREYGPP